MRRQVDPREILVDDARSRMQEARDPRRHGSSSTPVTWLTVAQRFRHQGRKQARAHAGLEHPAAAEAEPLQAGQIARTMYSGV